LSRCRVEVWRQECKSKWWFKDGIVALWDMCY
jgi:hypothetical protein